LFATPFHLHPSLIFAGKVKSLPLECSLVWGSTLHLGSTLFSSITCQLFQYYINVLEPQILQLLNRWFAYEDVWNKTFLMVGSVQIQGFCIGRTGYSQILIDKWVGCHFCLLCLLTAWSGNSYWKGSSVQLTSLY
jgi:hypothetical protein